MQLKSNAAGYKKDMKIERECFSKKKAFVGLETE